MEYGVWSMEYGLGGKSHTSYSLLPTFTISGKEWLTIPAIRWHRSNLGCLIQILKNCRGTHAAADAHSNHAIAAVSTLHFIQ